jgi:hypothetical protein
MEEHNIKEGKKVETSPTNALSEQKCSECDSQVKEQSSRLYNLLFLNFRISGCVCTVIILVVVLVNTIMLISTIFFY